MPYMSKFMSITHSNIAKLFGIDVSNLDKVYGLDISTGGDAAIAMCKNIQTGNLAYYIDYDGYAPNIDTLKTGGYISSYTLPDTGDFNYYVSSNRQFAAHWEGGTRLVEEVIGRYSIDHDDGQPAFRTDAQLTTWTGSFPA